MRFEALLVIFVLLMVAGVHALASSPAAESPAAPASGGEKPWVEVQNRVAALSAKNRQMYDQLQDLIRTKKAGATPARMLELDKEIDRVYKQWRENSEELKRQNAIFKYRFPERAAQNPDRHYDVNEVQSLDEIEEQVGLDGKLQRNLRRMRGQYGTPAKIPKTDPGVVVEKKEKSDSEKSIREAESPILRK